MLLKVMTEIHIYKHKLCPRWYRVGKKTGEETKSRVIYQTMLRQDPTVPREVKRLRAPPELHLPLAQVTDFSGYLSLWVHKMGIKSTRAIITRSAAPGVLQGLISWYLSSVLLYAELLLKIFHQAHQLFKVLKQN